VDLGRKLLVAVSKGASCVGALAQARVARILRNTDFNFKTKEPILWTPQWSRRSWTR
jgi:hypothetical protein